MPLEHPMVFLLPNVYPHLSLSETEGAGFLKKRLQTRETKQLAQGYTAMWWRAGQKSSSLLHHIHHSLLAWAVPPLCPHPTETCAAALGKLTISLSLSGLRCSYEHTAQDSTMNIRLSTFIFWPHFRTLSRQRLLCGGPLAPPSLSLMWKELVRTTGIQEVQLLLNCPSLCLNHPDQAGSFFPLNTCRGGVVVRV